LPNTNFFFVIKHFYSPHPPSSKVFKHQVQIKTPTATQSFHYPLSTTQRLPKSTYFYHTHTTNKIINCQKLVKHMIFRCF
jgi:hypothetical protein